MHLMNPVTHSNRAVYRIWASSSITSLRLPWRIPKVILWILLSNCWLCYANTRNLSWLFFCLHLIYLSCRIGGLLNESLISYNFIWRQLSIHLQVWFIRGFVTVKEHLLITVAHRGLNWSIWIVVCRVVIITILRLLHRFVSVKRRWCSNIKFIRTWILSWKVDVILFGINAWFQVAAHV